MSICVSCTAESLLIGKERWALFQFLRVALELQLVCQLDSQLVLGGYIRVYLAFLAHRELSKKLSCRHRRHDSISPYALTYSQVEQLHCWILKKWVWSTATLPARYYSRCARGIFKLHLHRQLLPPTYTYILLSTCEEHRTSFWPIRYAFLESSLPTLSFALSGCESSLGL